MSSNGRQNLARIRHPQDQELSSVRDDDDHQHHGQIDVHPHSEIQRLSEDTIRRITAEQAISDLCSVVKELVDNALDAESTTIKIRLFGQGLDIIEVSDDGCGVPPASRPYLATRYATSKITSLDDIYNGTGLSMGFRGEALFSMACVSDQLIVATRTEDEDLATKLVFGKDGLLVGEGQPISRKVGTTVAVVRPFASLPARRADLTRRIRGERTKIFKLIEAYGIFNVGVCFNLIDIVNKPNGSSREETALATSASSETLQETCSAILGPKFVKGMTAVTMSLEPILQRIYGENQCNWGIQGLVSTEPSAVAASSAGGKDAGGAGGGNTANNHDSSGPVTRTVQIYSINGRVVDLPKITALLKRLWTTFGGKKKPSAILAFTLPNEAFDINLAPDKQTVLLTHEKDLLELIEDHMTKQWSNQSSAVFAVNSQQQHGLNVGTNAKNDAMENEDGDDDDYEEGTDGERQMHKRRFAFVHDLSNAKMQHDLAGRHKFEETNHLLDTRSQLIGKENNRIARQTRDEGEPPVKKARVSLDSSGRMDDTAPANDDHPMDEVVSPRTSDLERRQWNEIEARFRRRGSNEEDEIAGTIAIQDIETEDPISPVSPVHLNLDKSLRHAQRSRPLHATQAETSSVSRPPKEVKIERTDQAATAEATTSHVTPSNRHSSLQRFAFQPVETGSDTIKSNQVSPSREKSIHELFVPTKGTSQRETEFSESNSNRGSDRLATATLADDSDSSRQESDRAQFSPTRVPLLPYSEEGPGEDDPVQHNGTNDNRKTPSSNRASTTPQISSTGTAAAGEAAPRIAWDSFSSTEQVCQSARLERLQMRQRKRKIDEIRKNIVTESTHPDTTMKRTDTTDLGAPAVDCDEDGNDDFDPSSPTSASLIRISKSTFRNGMQVIGQFNLGFILAKCSRNHLWILDQHACDEKFNFEQLCKNTVIHEQPLIKPLPLELSPIEEACVLDHMEIFQANGFRFAFNEEAPIRHRLSLTALPHSGAHEGRKAVQFGPSDVSALCSILTEGSSYDPGGGGTGTDGNGKYGNNAVRRHASALSSQSLAPNGQRIPGGVDTADRILARLPKAIAMFASRACRTSIMIGTALSQREMENVVQKLADVDHPFSCAHGRPTMRHVGNLLPLLWEDERRAAEHIAGPTITLTPMTQPDANT